MRKLDQDDIIFIDTYLKNSDILFTDIRVEMVDHVASEIEERMAKGDSREFYYVFKDYMVEKKAGLLSNNRKFLKSADKKIMRMLLKRTCSFSGVLGFISIVICFNLMAEFVTVNQLFAVYRYAPYVGMGGAMLAYYIIVGRKKERFSSLERIGFYFIILFQGIDLLANPYIQSEILSAENLTWITMVNSIIIYVITILMVVTFKLSQHYQLKFNSPV